MDACKTLGFDFYTDGEEYGGRYELITGNRLIGPTSENPYLTKPAISQAIKDAKTIWNKKKRVLRSRGNIWKSQKDQRHFLPKSERTGKIRSE